jgi:hypothetical protein
VYIELDWRGRLLSVDPHGGNGLLVPTIGVVEADLRHYTLFHNKTLLECE